MKRTENVVEEKRFDYRGYPCVVLFMDMGHRCGYVGIPADKPLTFDPEDEIVCHGGVTYCSTGLHLQDDGEDFLWVGFDTAHWNDGKDIAKIREYFGEDRASMVAKYTVIDNSPARSLAYCIEECERIVDQIVELFDEEEDE